MYDWEGGDTNKRYPLTLQVSWYRLQPLHGSKPKRQYLLNLGEQIRPLGYQQKLSTGAAVIGAGVVRDPGGVIKMPAVTCWPRGTAGSALTPAAAGRHYRQAIVARFCHVLKPNHTQNKTGDGFS